MALLCGSIELKKVLSSELLKKWVSFAQVKPSTELTYKRGIKNFAQYCRIKKIFVVTREILLLYRENLALNYSPSTANLYLTAVKLFFLFLHQLGYLEKNPAEHLKGFKIFSGHKKDSLTVEDVKKIYSSLNSEGLKNKRDRALIALMASTGLRVSEVVGANVGDIVTRGNKKFLYVQSKGKFEKSDCVEVSAEVFALVSVYLKARGRVRASSPLFASLSPRNRGGRLLACSLSRIIKTIFRACGYDSLRLTAHSLRHTFATLALQHGSSLRQVQQVLRHSKSSTTEIYLHDLNRYSNESEQLVTQVLGLTQ